MSELAISDNQDEQRYEARLGEDLVGYLAYELQPSQIVLVHTQVDRVAKGQGIGSRLVAAALEDIRERGLSTQVACPFVRAFLRRHPEYSDVAPLDRES
jgi:predicted GNAT family acetyltransferase